MDIAINVRRRKKRRKSSNNADDEFKMLPYENHEWHTNLTEMTIIFDYIPLQQSKHHREKNPYVTRTFPSETKKTIDVIEAHIRMTMMMMMIVMIK